MSEPLVLEAVRFEGAASVREVPAPGMITLKADLADPAVAEAIQRAVGLGMPGVRRILSDGAAKVAWMAPDEVLIVLPREGVSEALATLGTALGGAHHLVADVSDMRAVFRVEGGVAAREAVAKLAPVDLAPGVFEPGEVRRTRLAQIAAAIWMEDGGITLVCFRSVARYAFDALCRSASEDARVGYFAG